MPSQSDHELEDETHDDVPSRMREMTAMEVSHLANFILEFVMA